MNIPNQRTAWIDILKGIAIFFVVFGHSPYLLHLSRKVFNVAFSFHIPLFFFISGYLFKADITCKTLISRRCKSLLRPYFFTCISYGIVYILIKDESSPTWYLLWTLYGNGPYLFSKVFHLWFLPNLFLVTIMVWVLFDRLEFLRQSIPVQIFFTAFFLIIGVFGIQLFWGLEIPLGITNFFLHDGNLVLKNGLFPNPAYNKEALSAVAPFTLCGLPWSADFTLVSAAFFLSGYIIRKNALEVHLRKRNLAAVAILLFIVLHYFFNSTIDLNMRRYDDIVISTLMAYSAICACFYAAYKLGEVNNCASRALNYIGRYSLIIFIFHPVIQSKVYHSIVPFLTYQFYFIAFISALVIGIFGPLFLNWLFLERFKFFRYWYYAR